MHITIKSFTLRYFCAPGDYKVMIKVTKSLIFRGKMRVFVEEVNKLKYYFLSYYSFFIYIGVAKSNCLTSILLYFSEFGAKLL